MQKHNDGIINILHLLPVEVRERANRERVEEIFSALKPRERTVLELRYGLIDGKKYSYEKIGDALGMTATGAMKLFNRTIKKVIDRSAKSV
jgi:DNA-directed RNA polymerase sigma subunit (sigma70/sigma32)